VTTRSARSLLLFSGESTFPERLHVGRPNLGDRDQLMDRIGDILDSRWLTNQGPYAVEFERMVAERLQVRE
jgi:dTDP-4-amino-4,6-dideoxygalactose transaminase